MTNPTRTPATPKSTNQTSTNQTSTSQKSTTRTRVLTTAVAAGIAGAALAANPVAASASPAAPAAPGTAKIKATNAARADLMRERVAQIAKDQKGKRYILGATGPRAFDCSGLVVYSYKKATGKTLPRTSYSQIRAIEHVKPKNRKVGDVVFFRGGGHVGIYLGQSRIVHALNPGAGVRIDSTKSGWSGSNISGYGRVIIPG